MSNEDSQLSIPNFLTPEPARLAGGQPTAEQLKTAADDGLKQVIDLRPASEDHGFDEPAVATEYGLTYSAIPVSGPDDLTRENAEKLDKLLQQAGDAPTLVHCASGNRVGALIALRSAWLQSQSKKDALAQGRQWGLTKMEPIVAKVLA